MSEKAFVERDVAIVVGASKGIGEETALKLAATKQYNLLILARSKSELEEVAQHCETLGNIKVNVQVVDIMNEDEFERSLLEGISKLLPSFDSSKAKTTQNQFFVRVVVFCAGILNYSHSAASEYAKLDWKRTLSVNLLAAMTTARVSLPFMLTSGRGFLIFISSISHYSYPGFPGMSSYFASKDGIHGFARGLMQEVREYNIKVSCICPGMVNTGMGADITRGVGDHLLHIRPAEMIQPEDVADAVMFITSNGNTCCTTEVVLQHFKPISSFTDPFVQKPLLSQLSSNIYPIRQDSGKVALVTGASKGIGRQIAIRLAKMGYNIAMVARSKDKLDELSRYITNNFNVKTVTYPLDLSYIENAENVVHFCVRDLGNLHALILNAGVNRRKSVLLSSRQVWEEVLKVDLLSYVHASRIALPYMQLSTGINGDEDISNSKAIIQPSLIFISSMAIKDPGIAGIAPYYCAKYGLSGLAGCLFADVRHLNIKVSVIAPGLTNTELGNKKGPITYMKSEEMIQDSDVADCVEYVVNSPIHICPTQILVETQNHIVKELTYLNHAIRNYSSKL